MDLFNCLESCRIALMSFPNGAGVVRRPIVRSSWGVVLSEALYDINVCLRSEGRGAIGFVGGPFIVIIVVFCVFSIYVG